MKIECPECERDIPIGEFYEHMCEIHGWSLAKGEEFAEDWYQKTHPQIYGTPSMEYLERLFVVQRKCEWWLNILRR